MNEENVAYIHREYYSVIKRMKFASKWIELKDIMLIKPGTERQIPYVSFTCGD
jgi:hypothetical protein